MGKFPVLPLVRREAGRLFLSVPEASRITLSKACIRGIKSLFLKAKGGVVMSLMLMLYTLEN